MVKLGAVPLSKTAVFNNRYQVNLSFEEASKNSTLMKVTKQQPTIVGEIFDIDWHG
ncbi:MAG: hypothetical protein K2W94_05340 [Alphaproteobacteria bacterium]|nr:hypothetical protein [Alphaproteobacteria bacterium]